MVRVILDCIEIYIEKFFFFQVNKVIYSYYKLYNIFKYLVGISFYLVVVYVFCVWGGRVLDKYIISYS